MEVLGLGIISLGSLIALIGYIWLIVVGFQRGGALWGILIIIFSWIAGLVFCIVHKTGWLPLVLMVLGGVISGIGAVPLMMKAMGNLPR